VTRRYDYVTSWRKMTAGQATSARKRLWRIRQLSGKFTVRIDQPPDGRRVVLLAGWAPA